jgi:thiol-disulfide isomerase/thioredoxin
MSMSENPANAAAKPLVDSSRRRAAAVALGLAAAAAGVGTALLRTGSESSSGAEPVEGFWDLRWETPAGPDLAMRTFRGHPILINFWATWCPPCIEELPLIDAFFNENSSNGMQVIGIAVDKPAAVRAFLKVSPLRFPVAIAAMTGTDLGRRLGNLNGGLPFSVLVGGSGSILQRKLGRLTATDLAAWKQLK